MIAQQGMAGGIIFMLLAVLADAPSLYAGESHPVFRVDANWPKQLPHGYIFGPSGGVTVDAHDHVWIYSRPTSVRITLNNPPDENNGVPAPSVVELSADGRFLQGWGGVLAMSESERAQFDWPVQEHGIAVDNKGNVWVCGNGHDAKTGRDDDQCLKFTHDGRFLLQIGHSGKGKGSLDTENLGHPSQPVYWEKTNEVFISDGYANRRVYVADADTGAFKRMWGAYGHVPDDNASRARVYAPAPQQFNLLHGLTISKDGIVYVAERNSNRIQAFTLQGKFLKEGWVAPSTPQRDFGTAFGVALSGDKAQRFLYVADGHNECIHVLDRRSLLEIPGSRIGHAGLYPGQFANIHVIASDSKGNLYVGDGVGRFQKFLYLGLSHKKG